jgi:4-hydroxy-2-oxoheptanedioate aldolase
MTPNHVKRKLSAGTPSVGSWLNLGSPISAELIAALGFDWLCVDMEHGWRRAGSWSASPTSCAS